MFPELIIELLRDGYRVNFSAPGHSMYPTIVANENIMVKPIDPGTIRLGDIILYQSNGRLIAHRVVRIEKEAHNTLPQSQAPDEIPSNLHIEGDSPSSTGSAFRAQHRPNEALRFIFRGDASSGCDAPVDAGQVLGKVISIERYGCCVDPYGFGHKLGCLAIFWLMRFKRLLRWSPR